MMRKKKNGERERERTSILHSSMAARRRSQWPCSLKPLLALSTGTYAVAVCCPHDPFRRHRSPVAICALSLCFEIGRRVHIHSSQFQSF